MIAIAKQCHSRNHHTLLPRFGHLLYLYVSDTGAGRDTSPAKGTGWRSHHSLRPNADREVVELVLLWLRWLQNLKQWGNYMLCQGVTCVALPVYVKLKKTSHPPCHPEHKQTSNYADVCDIDKVEIRVMKGITGVMPHGQKCSNSLSVKRRSKSWRLRFCALSPCCNSPVTPEYKIKYWNKQNRRKHEIVVR